VDQIKDTEAKRDGEPLHKIHSVPRRFKLLMSTMLPSVYEAVPMESAIPSVEVLAPASLPAGFVFWVELDTKSFPVTVVSS
jgi:hypothetical protein